MRQVLPAPIGVRFALSLLLASASICGCAGAPLASSPSVASKDDRAHDAPSPQPKTAQSEPVANDEAQLIDAMLPRVSHARGIKPTHAVPGKVLDRVKLVQRVREHVAREIPTEAIRNEGLALQLLGFVPTRFDYEQAEYSLLEEQLAGYYEPSDKTMYLAAELKHAEAEATLAHELVHALQDMRWDLGARSAYRPGESDRGLATSALAEGDATSAMFDVMIQAVYPDADALDQSDEAYAEKIREGVAEGPGGQFPEVMRTSLAAPYLYGMTFVQTLRRRGGWAEVDRVWDNPPSTTEQILHMDKLDAREPAIAIAAPPYASLGAGWVVADTDTYGELGMLLTLEPWMGDAAASQAAAGWGGDRAILVRRGDDAALGWHVRYDVGRAVPDELAKRAFYGLTRALEARLGPATVKDVTSFVCLERKDRGPLAVGKSGRDLAFVAGPSHAAGAEWTSAGDCALAKKWVTEMLSAQP